jgi:hypothetical protein
MEADPMERDDEGLPVVLPDRAVAPECIDVAAAARRVSPLDLTYMRGVEAGLQEWASPEDEKAYADL